MQGSDAQRKSSDRWGFRGAAQEAVAEDLLPALDRLAAFDTSRSIEAFERRPGGGSGRSAPAQGQRARG